PISVTGLFTTTTVSLFNGVTVNAGEALPGAFTFTSLPTPNTSIGERTGGGRWFYFPNYCGAYCSSATVIAGEVVDNEAGHVFDPGQHIGYFTAQGAVTTFAPGTIIQLSGVATGTQLFMAGSSQILSTTTVSAAPGTPSGTTVTNNPDGSITTVVTGNQTINKTVQLPALAPMLAPGSQSWSMRLVSGADL